MHFALRPKFSGNVDLRLNQIDYRVIDNVISKIKFMEDLTLNDQIKKI
jgi:hypothetical protein